MSLWPKNGLKMSKVYALKELISHAVFFPALNSPLSFGFSQPATFDRSFLPPDVIPIPGRRETAQRSSISSCLEASYCGMRPGTCILRRSSETRWFFVGNRETGKPYWVPKPQMMENSERTSKHFQKPRNIIRFKLWGGTILGKWWQLTINRPLNHLLNRKQSRTVIRNHWAHYNPNPVYGRWHCANTTIRHWLAGQRQFFVLFSDYYYGI